MQTPGFAGFRGWWICTSLILAWSQLACDGNGFATQAFQFREAGADSTDIPLDSVAICVWPQVGLRAEPGLKRQTREGKSNYLVTLYYGEKVKVLGETEVLEPEGRTWMRVQLKDGQVGWVNDYLFERKGRLAVVLEAAELYRRPDLMTLRNDRVMPGEIIVLLEQQGAWRHISGREKRKKGWIQDQSPLSTSSVDVKAALLYQNAVQERTASRRKTRLEAILADKTLSGTALRPLIETRIRESATADSIQANNAFVESNEKLYITDPQAVLFAQPVADPNQILHRFSAGEVCYLLGRGSREPIGELSDYWYKVRTGSKEGWVYGYYTSLRALD
ncbi:MAG: hypothetical protein NW241_14450 [Bacteroidia bacterium]|nr:hypothetical protein [Bacteroidia bacterium]